jgi:hypothetical protein
VDPIATPDSARDLPLTELTTGQHAPMEVSEAVYRDAEAWAAVSGAFGELAADPDFPLEAVLVAAVDARSGGHRVRFDRVYTEGDAPDGEGPSVAIYVVEEPGAGCMTTMALTRPFAAVAVAGLPRGPVRFVERRETYACE